MNREDGKMLDVFQQKCLRRILKISWEDDATNEEVLRRVGVHQLSSEVKRRRWKMIGHVLRQERGNDCSIALTWIPEGRRNREDPKQHGEGVWKRKEARRGGGTGMRRGQKQRTGKSGNAL